MALRLPLPLSCVILPNRAAMPPSADLPEERPAVPRLLPTCLVVLLLLFQATAAEAAGRNTGKYPLIAGTWQEADGILVAVAQHQERFVASCTYRNDDGVEVHWRAEGTISEDGEITASLVHARPEGYKSQTRTARLAPDGRTIYGHASWDDGGHDFAWTLKEPSGASESLDRHAFVPQDGKCLLVVGQDNPAFDAYVKATGVVPGGVMVYTSVHRVEGLDGFDRLLRKYPNCAFQIGLYMVGSLDKVAGGELDGNVRRLGKWIKSSRRPVYLRVGYEFDLPANGYEPEKYVEAFRHVRDKLDDQGVTNVAYVWHSFAAGSARIDDWYPGDDYVDWVAVSLFGRPNGQTARVAEFARQHGKPLMIAEATPRGLGTRRGRESWDGWFAPCFGFIDKYHVKAFCYVDWDWESQPMFRGQGWGDCRIEANGLVKARWLETTGSFLKSSGGLYEELGYRP
jgi:hypothetical protein